MKATGQVLKSRREELKISLAEVSISTKITPRMLQALEAGEMSRLPARTFLRGFVKSYATFLKMDVEEVLTSFNNEMNILDPPPVVVSSEEEIHAHDQSQNQTKPIPSSNSQSKGKTDFKPWSQSRSTLQKSLWTLGLVILFISIVLTYKIVQKYEREGQVIPPSTMAPGNERQQPIMPPSPAKPENHQAIAPAPQPHHAPTAPPLPSTTTTSPIAKETKETKEPKTDTAVTKPDTTMAHPTVSPPVPPQPTPPPSSLPSAHLKEDHPPDNKPAATHEIIIEALDKVQLTFKINNGQEKKISLQPDQVHTLKAVGSVSIDISDGGAVNIIHNGRDLGVPGDLGRPKKISLP